RRNDLDDDSADDITRRFPTRRRSISPRRRSITPRRRRSISPRSRRSASPVRRRSLSPRRRSNSPNNRSEKRRRQGGVGFKLRHSRP
ncbi:hypothetical protein H0H92_015249, partial [Tricholoma furcatifolium]